MEYLVPSQRRHSGPVKIGFKDYDQTLWGHPSVKPANLVLGIAVVLWSGLSVLAVQSENSLDVFVDPVERSVYSSKDEYTAINWLNPGRTSFTCLLLRSDGSRRCGLDLELGDGERNGIDISKYTTVRLAVKYEGPADKLRFSFRNAYKETDLAVGTADYHNIEDAKYHSTILPMRTGVYVYDISLDNLKVPNWWISQSNEDSEERRTPDRANVVRMGFDIETPMPVGQHYFDVIGLTLAAPWLNAGNTMSWLGLSVLYLVVVGIIYNFFRRKTRIQEPSEEMCELIDKLEEASSKSADLKVLAMYDPLTGLLNQRAALDLIKDFVRRNSLAGTALVLLDIDHFKSVNEVYGHDIGDEVLGSVCKSTLASLGEEDTAVRWGGEEILVICPKTKPEGAKKVAEKLRLQIAEMRFPSCDLSISVSMGVANVVATDTFEQALKRADDALLRAKNSGRNRVCYEDDLKLTTMPDTGQPFPESGGCKEFD